MRAPENKDGEEGGWWGRVCSDQVLFSSGLAVGDHASPVHAFLSERSVYGNPTRIQLSTPSVMCHTAVYREGWGWEGVNHPLPPPPPPSSLERDWCGDPFC